MRSKQSIIDSQRNEICALRRYVSDLKHRHDKAIIELASLAQGLGVKPTYTTDSHVDWMKYKAAICLSDIAKSPLREWP